MLSPKQQSFARACARIVRDGRLIEVAQYLVREEHLLPEEAVAAAVLALQAPLDEPLLGQPGTVPDVSFDAVVAAVRRYVLDGRALSPVRDVAIACCLPKALIPTVFRQLEREGLIEKQQIPNAPAYMTRWVRKVKTPWTPPSQFDANTNTTQVDGQ